jgi:aerobic carbon-monoxide dehydrogenase medium subunit
MRVSNYIAPNSLEEAITLLAENRAALALAGGNSLLIEPNRSRMSNATLVDLRRISALAGLRSQADSLWIGAMTPLFTIAGDATIQERYAALAEAARSVGDAQVRNRATIGGNLADGDPGADLPAALLALGAQVHVQGAQGSRVLAVDDLLVGPSQTALKQGELITAITLPAPAAQTGSAYEKFTHPATLFAICGVATSITLATDGSVSACRAALTGAVESVARLSAVEAALNGKQPDASTLAAAAEQAGEKLRFRGDRFASTDYRCYLTKVLTQRVISRAVERATRLAGARTGGPVPTP